jgi:hypothetical protein
MGRWSPADASVTALAFACSLSINPHRRLPAYPRGLTLGHAGAEGSWITVAASNLK